MAFIATSAFPLQTREKETRREKEREREGLREKSSFCNDDERLELSVK
jgi:hypothetical protein